MRCSGRHKQARPGKGKDIFFTFRQRDNISLCKLHCGNNRVVVGYFFTVQHLCKLRREVCAGRSYTLVAELHDAKTGEVLYDGKTVEPVSYTHLDTDEADTDAGDGIGGFNFG